MLKEGDQAPAFNAASNQGREVNLVGLAGKKTVLFFYPKDDTPGCTIESCEFRDLSQAYREEGVQVYGVSADDLESHDRFASKYELDFPLLADPDKSMCKAFGVWGEQEWQGKRFMGIARTTFVIDEAGRIAKVYEKVNPKGHAAQVLDDVKGL